MNLNFKSFGSGPALIILHGLFGSLDNWQTLAKQFADEFSVFIVDQRNHGRSPHDGDFSYEDMAYDLSDFMDQQGIYSASVLGHSMGGKTAMTFAVQDAIRLEKLVVADMAPVQYEPHHDEILKALNDFPLHDIETREAADEWLSSRIPEFSVRQFLLKNLDRNKDKSFKWKFNLEVISGEYENILSSVQSDHPIEVPTLFIRGGKSPYVLDAYKPQIMELFPQAEFETIENAGHWLHAEAPDEFFQKVNAWLLR
ncbi:MAG: alpha/beta fold hydrolase [Bacteroidia bacterium]|nr:alpha/beta fold hydrolase [Bacteroidia bacterium]